MKSKEDSPRNKKNGVIASKNVTLNIRLEQDRRETITLYKGENTNDIVKQFALKHNIDKDTEMLLKRLLESRLANIT